MEMKTKVTDGLLYASNLIYHYWLHLNIVSHVQVHEWQTSLPFTSTSRKGNITKGSESDYFILSLMLMRVKVRRGMKNVKTSQLFKPTSKYT